MNNVLGMLSWEMSGDVLRVYGIFTEEPLYIPIKSLNLANISGRERLYWGILFKGSCRWDDIIASTQTKMLSRSGGNLWMLKVWDNKYKISE